MTKKQEQRSLADTPETAPPDDQDPPGGPEPPADGGAADGDPGEAPAFEEALAELETIVEELEAGALGLEEAMDRFERGLSLVKVCRSKLQQAELKVQELLEDGELEDLEG